MVVFFSHEAPPGNNTEESTEGDMLSPDFVHFGDSDTNSAEEYKTIGASDGSSVETAEDSSGTPTDGMTANELAELHATEEGFQGTNVTLYGELDYKSEPDYNVMDASSEADLIAVEEAFQGTGVILYGESEYKTEKDHNLMDVSDEVLDKDQFIYSSLS